MLSRESLQEEGGPGWPGFSLGVWHVGAQGGVEAGEWGLPTSGQGATMNPRRSWLRLTVLLSLVAGLLTGSQESWGPLLAQAPPPRGSGPAGPPVSWPSHATYCQCPPSPQRPSWPPHCPLSCTLAPQAILQLAAGDLSSDSQAYPALSPGPQPAPPWPVQPWRRGFSSPFACSRSGRIRVRGEGVVWRD